MTGRWTFSLCAVVAVVAAASTTVDASAAPPDHTHSFFWAQPTQPKLDGSYAELAGVSAVSADDVWAVGLRVTRGGVATLVEHWNGRTWSIVATPNPTGAWYSSLSGVDAVSANNVWAVGTFIGETGGERTLIEHWNGTSWHRVPSPNPSATNNTLTGVSAISATDVWAVGYDDPPGRSEVHTLSVHWNGGSWSAVRTPIRPGVDRGFFGVNATSASSGWAVGATVDRQNGRLKSLVEHWNGERWHQAPIVSPSDVNFLRSVSVVAPGNAWAVGDMLGTRGRTSPLVEHLSAGHWQQVTPRGLGGAGVLTSVSGADPDDVWAVGSVGGASVLAHWNGRAWSLTRGLASMTNALNGVTTNGSTATWAVGLNYYHGFHSAAPFEERWNGRVWTR